MGRGKSGFDVSPSVTEPIPGWVDTLNGPTGVMVGAAKGVIRSMLCDGETTSEIIPVDYAINALITLVYDQAKLAEKPEKVPVCNITIPEYRKVPWRKVMEMGKELNEEYPFEAGLWYPDGQITTNKFVHTINHLLFMWLPAYLIDFLLLCAGQKRFMIRLQTRIGVGLEVLQFFTMRQWVFKSERYQGLWENLSAKDKELFNMDMSMIEDKEYFKISLFGGRQYLMKEPLSTIPKARKQLKFMYALDRISKTIIIGFFIYWLLKTVGIWSAIQRFSSAEATV